MAQTLDLKRLLATGRQLTETGRSQALQLGTDLVEQGRQATEQITAAVDELVSRGGRERMEELRQTVRGEVQQQLRTLGSEIKDHLAAQGQLAADRISALVGAQDQQRREQAEAVREAVRDEVQRQLGTLGLATGDDLAVLRRAIRDDLTALELRTSSAAPTTTEADPADAGIARS
jgi:polyhydroxyalkanoate synthesis regulator phasin